MRYGYWMPVFGGWLRNVEDEGMAASWDYVKRLAQRSEQIGYDLSLVAELFLNDIKGIEADSLEAWTAAAALAAVTERLELMVAVRPTFHPPAILAKQAATLDHISGGRLSLNVVSSWWKDEARRYGVPFDEHDDRYARTGEWLDVLDGAWREHGFSYTGSTTAARRRCCRPSRSCAPERARPTLYAGGRERGGESLIAASATPT
jgi:FMNH2-dependent dimethyl sulfone monooxygenase